MPKGVIWAHDDLREISLIALRRLGPVPENTAQVVGADPDRSAPAGASCPRCR